MSIEQKKKQNITMVICTYHNHHTLMKQHLGYKNPEDVIQEGTAEKNRAHLTITNK
jgi:hypothetical protein